MEKKSKKQVIIAITVLLLVTLTLLGITYAYYRTRIIGNENDKSISVTSKVLEVTYSDDNAVISANDIEPGDIITKTFTVSNTGDDTVSYAVIFDNVENSFMRTNDWTFTLKKGSDVVKSGVIPRTTSYVLTNISIAADVTDTYTLEIAYENSSEDQSEDMGASLSLRVNIADGISTKFDTAASGTLLSAIGNDNLISEPLTVPGQEKSTTNGYKLLFDNTKSELTQSTEFVDYYYTYASSYNFNEDNGTFTLVNPQVGLYSEIYSNLVGKYVVSASGSTSAKIEDSTNISTVYQITETTRDIIKYKTTEEIVPKGLESVLASTEDDYGASYYFRGGVENNFVNFSGMCWRIVRVEGNGNIKLALADENNECNNENYSIYNVLSAYVNGEKYIYYKSSPVGDESDLVYETSDIPVILKTWAEKTDKPLDTSNLVTDAKWCNDISKSVIKYYDSEWNIIEDSSLAEYTDINYGAYDRLVGKESEPTLKCDMTGLDDSNATKYESAIGILSADEIVFAGGTSENNDSGWGYYLMDNANGNWSWTLSPHSFNSFVSSYLWNVGTDGGLGSINFDFDASVRPAVVIKSSTTISGGNGTQSNPYVVS